MNENTQLSMNENTQVTESVNRYRIEELQDHKGNVVYPQTDARGVWVDDDSLYALLNATISDGQINAILNGQGGSEL